jgi:hypothetical protein
MNSTQIVISPIGRIREGESLMDDPAVVEYTQEIREHRTALNNCGKLSDEDHEYRLDRIATATHILGNFHNCDVNDTWDHRCDRGNFYLI